MQRRSTFLVLPHRLGRRAGACVSLYVLAGAILVGPLAAPAHPQPGPTREAVQAWFDGAWASAAEFPELPGVSVSWSVEQHPPLTASALAELAVEMEGKPDHPARRTYETGRRRLDHGPDVYRRRAWLWGSGLWRCGTDFDSHDGRFWDFVAAPGGSWSMTPDALIVYGGGESGQDVMVEERTFVPELRLLLTGGLATMVEMRLRPGPLSLAGLEWEVVATLPPSNRERPDVEKRIVGHWSVEAGRGFVDSVTTLESRARPEFAGRVQRFAGWRFEPGLNTWVAGRVEEFLADGTLERALVFENVEPAPPGEFEAVTAIPRADGNDAVRGPVTFTRVVDHRRGTLRVQAEDGVQTIELPGDRPVGAPRPWIRWMGWALALALGVALVVLRMRGRAGVH